MIHFIEKTNRLMISRPKETMHISHTFCMGALHGSRMQARIDTSGTSCNRQSRQELQAILEMGIVNGLLGRI